MFCIVEGCGKLCVHPLHQFVVLICSVNVIWSGKEGGSHCVHPGSHCHIRTGL